MDDNNNKIKINMLSMADSVDGQGVGSAYLELMKLLNEDGKNDFEIFLNKGTKYDVIHAHTVEPRNYLKLKFSKNPTVAYVHFLPDTLDGAIKLPKPIFKIFKKYVISFYKSADYLVVVNPIFKKDIAKAGIKEDKITYIPNFVSKEMFYKKTDKEIKDIADVVKGVKTLVRGGSMEEAKQQFGAFGTVVDAVGSVLDKFKIEKVLLILLRLLKNYLKLILYGLEDFLLVV